MEDPSTRSFSGCRKSDVSRHHVLTRPLGKTLVTAHYRDLRPLAGGLYISQKKEKNVFSRPRCICKYCNSVSEQCCFVFVFKNGAIYPVSRSSYYAENSGIPEVFVHSAHNPHVLENHKYMNILCLTVFPTLPKYCHLLQGLDRSKVLNCV